MPAGVIQPSSVRAGDHSADFSLWRNIMREHSEEFLGNPEHGGDGGGADCGKEPLRSIDAARRAGKIRMYCAESVSAPSTSGAPSKPSQSSTPMRSTNSSPTLCA